MVRAPGQPAGSRPGLRGARRAVPQKAHRIARLGIGRTFQTAGLFGELTVPRNLDIAAGAGREAMETIGLTAQRDAQAGIPARGQKQWLETGMRTAMAI